MIGYLDLIDYVDFTWHCDVKSAHDWIMAELVTLKSPHD